MAMKRMTRSRAASRSVVGALLVLVVGAFSAGSALAFPDYGSTVNVNLVSAGPQTEFIYITGTNSMSGNVYMGPYQLQTSPGGTLYMMCFDAGARAYYSPAWTAIASNTNQAAGYFGAYGQEKVQMIAWLTTQWDTTNLTTSANNANINKAMWEIMADYTGTLTSLNVNPGLEQNNFYLKENDSDILGGNGIIGVTAFLKDAYAHRSDSTQANFLIPVTSVNGVLTLNKNIQPFVQPVPEPGTLLLLGSGLVGLGLHGWRKRSKAQK